MARAVAVAFLPGGWERMLEISSAGTHAGPGQPASLLAIEVLREIGIDLRGHVSRAISEELVAGSDLIVVMEAVHKDEIERLVPGSASKIVLLGGLDGERSAPDIEDPIGGDRETYVQTREEIRRLVSLLIDYLAARFDFGR